jgi:hypothetical protein
MPSGGAAASTAGTSKRRDESAAEQARAATDALTAAAPAAVTAPTEPPDSTAPARPTVAGEQAPTTPERGARTPAARTTAFFFPPSTLVALWAPETLPPPEGVRRPLELEREMGRR